MPVDKGICTGHKLFFFFWQLNSCIISLLWCCYPISISFEQCHFSYSPMFQSLALSIPLLFTIIFLFLSPSFPRHCCSRAGGAADKGRPAWLALGRAPPPLSLAEVGASGPRGKGKEANAMMYLYSPHHFIGDLSGRHILNNMRLTI